MSFRRQPGYKQVVFEETQKQVDHEVDDSQSMYSQESPLFTRSRGRPTPRTPSPIKALNDITEDQMSEGGGDRSYQKSLPMEPPVSSAKRPRSPMKQLFGERGLLGRSASIKELPNEEHRKKGMKHLVEKLNQRVGGMVSEDPVRQKTRGLTR